MNTDTLLICGSLGAMALFVTHDIAKRYINTINHRIHHPDRVELNPSVIRRINREISEQNTREIVINNITPHRRPSEPQSNQSSSRLSNSDISREIRSLLMDNILHLPDTSDNQSESTTIQSDRSNPVNESAGGSEQEISSSGYIPGSILEHIVNLYIIGIDHELDSNKPACLDIPNDFDRSDMPNEFKCPISRSIMKDPVISADGYTYERQCIETHISSDNNNSPLSNEALLFPYLIPNWNLRKLIAEYVRKNIQSESNDNEEDEDNEDNEDNEEDDISDIESDNESNTEQNNTNVITSDTNGGNSYAERIENLLRIVDTRH